MFQGSLVALVTPMHQEGTIDFDALQKLVDWHLSNNTEGIVLLGTTGESATIESPERHDIITRVIKQVNHRVPVIIGAGSNSTQHTITLTQEAMHAGADAVLLVTPYYNKPTQEGLFQHYRAIASAVPIPQILYNVPTRTCCDLLPQTVARLAAFPNIVGVKEATGNLDRLKELLALNTHMDFFSGDDETAMEFIFLGGKGVISVVANVAPKIFQSMCTAALSGDRITAQKINATLHDLYRTLFIETNPIPTKWALEKMGLIQSGIRLPLTTLSVQHHGDVQAAMKAFNP